MLENTLETKKAEVFPSMTVRWVRAEGQSQSNASKVADCRAVVLTQTASDSGTDERVASDGCEQGGDDRGLFY